MNDYIEIHPVDTTAMLCNRCGCIVSGVRLDTHDAWHLMLGEIRETTDGELYARQWPPA